MNSFQTLTRTIERILHIRCSCYKEDYIQRRILSRMRLRGVEGFDTYHHLLLSSPDEQEALRDALTINVTKFFRDPAVFQILQREILPDLLTRKHRVRIWCAGCSSGEEPYSIAMILQDLRCLHPTLSAVIYATDIDNRVLQRAEEGIYERRSLDHLDRGQIKRHFSLLPDGRYAVKPHVREWVRFRRHDLLTDAPVARFLDLITCRNVTIYFTEEQKNALARTFHAALNSGGYYVMGKTEYLGREVEALFTPFNTAEKIYTRGDTTPW
ncbi:MAG: protein-glutamate O-methyltransferase CheR [Methanomicrobiales archaeon]|nr:protein-glutamate O-methyltransferase CheR [Methanomicrobiales archaeon]MDI6876509.1 protein-glutamate O-methyltransferase CheR [Methanomicrobiales archaeon]